MEKSRKSGLFLGFDTSNYTTSIAVFDAEKNEVFSQKRLLDVKPGELGLRQSDAVFAHTKRLPELSQALFSTLSGDIKAVAASTRPRAVDGSYMPCFLVGEGQGRVLADALGAPFFAVSHQQGHIAAAAWSAGRLDLLDREFLAYHASGGTTELLHVRPGEDGLPVCEKIGGTTDLAAGQIVDRCGVALGLGFPCGAELEQLALRCDASVKPFLPKSEGCEFSLSGLENKFQKEIESGSPERAARFVLASVSAVLARAAERALEAHPGLELLCAGGVMCNSLIRANFERKFGAHFAEPRFSSDNAAGVAILAARLYGEVNA